MAWYWSTSPSIIDPDIVEGFDNPMDIDNWSCAQWKEYYLKVKAKYNKQFALETLSKDIEQAGFFADVNNCKYNCDWVNFFKSEGVESVGNVFSNIYCTTNEVVENVGDVATNITQTAKTATNPLILFGLAALGIYIIYQNHGKK